MNLDKTISLKRHFEGKEVSLKLRLDKQITGIYTHLNNLQQSHRDIERNSRRAKGHLDEAIRLSLKLRRLYQQQCESLRKFS